MVGKKNIYIYYQLVYCLIMHDEGNIVENFFCRDSLLYGNPFLPIKENKYE